MYVVIIAILSMLACMLVAALISDPGLIVEFAMVLWKLLGRADSPFFWMLTFPASIMIGSFGLYLLWLVLTKSPGNEQSRR